VRVGIDLVSVDSVREAIQTHSDRYLERVYTERELQDCRTSAGVDPERLAARFAAKEATLKVLRPTDQTIPWRAIEVLRDPSGWVELQLSGPAAALAAAAGLTDFSVSLTHEGGFASAIVVASYH
jgi:holo-[acyl-carrier protein] synthase